MAARPAHATAQVGNLLLIDGEYHTLWSQPLAGTPYRVVRRMEEGWSLTTACWAGHLTVWSLEAEQLWFLGTQECLGSKALSADEVLEGVTETRVAADWYSGTLVLPQGEVISYAHSGWDTLYSEQRRIVVERGQVMTDSVTQLVAPGFVRVEEIWLPAPLLLPRDITEAALTSEQHGDQQWLILQGAQPDRRLQLQELAAAPEDADLPALLSSTLTDHLGTSDGQQHRTLDDRGMIVWADHPGSNGKHVRVFAWVSRNIFEQNQFVLFELHLPQSELEAFTTHLDLP